MLRAKPAARLHSLRVLPVCNNSVRPRPPGPPTGHARQATGLLFSGLSALIKHRLHPDQPLVINLNVKIWFVLSSQPLLPGLTFSAVSAVWKHLLQQQLLLRVSPEMKSEFLHNVKEFEYISEF